MAFRDQDPLEELIGTRVEYMTPRQLISYIQTYHEAYGIRLAYRKHADDKVFIELQATYGKRDAGRIVKWAFYGGGPHKGVRRDGGPIGLRDFAPGSKWWTDQLHLEMQRDIKSIDLSAKTYESTVGSMQLGDL